MATQATSEHELSEILAEYVDAYARRGAKSKDGSVFSRAEPELLVALFESRRVRGMPEGPLRKALERVEGAIKRALTSQQEHGHATDMAGFIAADAYGALPMARPPVEELEWVFDSGQERGAIKGLFGVAWRVLFLLSAMPYLGWPRQGRAEAELARRLPDLESKLERTIEPAADDAALGLSQLSRLSWLAMEVARYVPDRRFDDFARQLVDRAQSTRDAGGLSTEQAEEAESTGALAQLALAAHGVGQTAVAHGTLADLLAGRVDPDRQLLWTQPGGTTYEMSPWLPLALYAFSGGMAAPAVKPRRVRDLFRIGRST